MPLAVAGRVDGFCFAAPFSYYIVTFLLDGFGVCDLPELRGNDVIRSCAVAFTVLSVPRRFVAVYPHK